jgi:CRISPR-associated endoribonuclease Cas6
MRLLLKTTKNKEMIPFNYQSKLVSCIHKWLGKDNEVHGETSLLSFSWLNGTEANRIGINIRYQGNWFISAYKEEVIKKMIEGIQKDPYMFCGIEVAEITIQQDPQFGTEHKFSVANPVFIKRKYSERTKFFYSGDEEADELLTESLRYKLSLAQLPEEGVEVKFDDSYSNPTTKGYVYNGIYNKGSVCPVIIKGTPEQIAFAWNVGVGSNTGIGFGALN